MRHAWKVSHGAEYQVSDTVVELPYKFNMSSPDRMGDQNKKIPVGAPPLSLCRARRHFSYEGA